MPEIWFPNLGIKIDHLSRTAIKIGNFNIYWYGLIIGAAIILATLLVIHEAKRSGQRPEDYIDFASFAIVLSVIGARLYYVIFSWDMYKDNLIKIFAFREGGLAIYGGVITAIVVVFIFAKIKGLSPFLLFDTGGFGLITGQMIGRWGNFFNREAFGEYTNGLFAMRLPVDAVRSSDITTKMWNHAETVKGVMYIQVHPTFLYESMWNLGVLIFMLWYRKRKKFDGEMLLIYLLGYGLGRSWIEGLRTDQLIFFGTGIPVSQALSMLLVLISGTVLVYKHKQLKKAKKGDVG